MDLSDRKAEIRLSAQRALLNEVPPTLRAVVLSVEEQSVEVRCYFDGPISEEDRESISCVETEMLADREPHEEVIARCIRLDTPASIDDSGVWVYARRE